MGENGWNVLNDCKGFRLALKRKLENVVLDLHLGENTWCYGTLAELTSVLSLLDVLSKDKTGYDHGKLGKVGENGWSGRRSGPKSGRRPAKREINRTMSDAGRRPFMEPGSVGGGGGASE